MYYLRRFLAFAVLLSLCIGMSGCGSSTDNAANQVVTNDTEAEITTEVVDEEFEKQKVEIEEAIVEAKDSVEEEFEKTRDNVIDEIVDEDYCKTNRKAIKKTYKRFSEAVSSILEEVDYGEVCTQVGEYDAEDKVKYIDYFYDVFDDLLGSIYDEADDCCQDIYDHCDSLVYDSKLASKMEDDFNSAMESMNKKREEALSDLSSKHSLIRKEFLKGNYDVDEILAEIEEPEEEEEATTEAKKKSAKKKSKKKKSNSSGVNPELKAFLDEYEKVMDEYCKFMKKYNNSSDQSSMMMDYLNYLSKYSEMTEKLDEWDQDEMSDADLNYYLEVTSRVSKKLIDTGASMGQ